MKLDADGVVRESWEVNDDLRQVGLIDPANYYRDAFIYAFMVTGSPDEYDPVQRAKYLVKREVYLARYGRLAPSEMQHLTSDQIDERLTAVSELVKAEMGSRSALDPHNEDE